MCIRDRAYTLRTPFLNSVFYRRDFFVNLKIILSVLLELDVGIFIKKKYAQNIRISELCTDHKLTFTKIHVNIVTIKSKPCIRISSAKFFFYYLNTLHLV